MDKVNSSSGLIDFSTEMNKALAELENLDQAAIDNENKLNQLKLSHIQELTRLKAESLYKEKQEAIATQNEIDKKVFTAKLAQEKKLTAVKNKQEEERKKLRKKLGAAGESPEEIKKIMAAQRKADKEKLDALKKRHEVERAEIAKTAAAEIAAEKKAAAVAKGRQMRSNFAEGVFGAGKSFKERNLAIKSAFTSDGENSGITKGLATMAGALSDMAKKLENNIDKIGSYRSAIDTRLQGSKNATKMGSYWDKMNSDVKYGLGVSAFYKQETVNENIKSMVGQGIAFNVEQRAFLQTISEKIATTFNATDSTLLRLVRIQQADSTAARLGMESALTSFLNNMYETTEYMSNIASNIRSSIEEASALMGAQDAISFEYQVQKWIGSMYSAGMSQTAVNTIGSALGKLAAGDVSALTGGGAGNLLVMAANQAGLNISSILAKGLDENSTNALMGAMVNYMSNLYLQSSGSKVVQQQLASVYGVQASDLLAASGMNTGGISGSSLNYSGALAQLSKMNKSARARTSWGEMLTNVWDNFQYTMAAGIANNPVLYGLYKSASLLDSVAGGIAIPAFSVMGNGYDLETTVADLMRVTALSGSILGGLGSVVSGIAGGFAPDTLLRNFGISTSGINTVTRGTGNGIKIASGANTSSSGLVGQGNSSDIQNKTIGDASDSASNKQVEAAEENNEATMTDVNNSIVQIYQLLCDVTTGAKNIYATSNTYGLSTGSGSGGM